MWPVTVFVILFENVVIFNCDGGVGGKCTSLLWRVRNFSSPGAARSHMTALNNAEGTFKFNGVVFSEMYLSNSPQAV